MLGQASSTRCRRALAGIGVALALAGCHREGQGGDAVTPESSEGAAARAPVASADRDAGGPSAQADVRAARADGRATDDARDGLTAEGDALAAAAPEPSAQAMLAALEPGIVSRELAGACDLHPAESALPALLARCGEAAASSGADAPSGADAAAPAGCDRQLPLGVAGRHEDGRWAIVSAPWVDACADRVPYRLYEATLPWLHFDDVTTLEPRGEKVEPAALAWLARRMRRGFEPVEDLVRYSCEYERWVNPLRGLTLLRAPFEGWMLTVGRGRRTLPLRLVGPGNKRVWDLEPIALKPGVLCEADDKKKGVCAREQAGEVLQLVLSPNRRSLVATFLVGTGERCATGHVVHRVLKVPDGVRSILPKPAWKRPD